MPISLVTLHGSAGERGRELVRQGQSQVQTLALPLIYCKEENLYASVHFSPYKMRLVRLFGTPRPVTVPDSSVPRILQAGILEWLPFPSPGDLPHPGIKPGSPSLAGGSLLSELPGSPTIVKYVHASEESHDISINLWAFSFSKCTFIIFMEA